MTETIQLNIRVPQPIHKWVRHTSERTGLSQKAFVVSLIEDAMERSNGPSLFDEPAVPDSTSTQDGQIPFRFIDLFAGIGGLRIGLEQAGGRCVFSCEIDPYARKTYKAWFGDEPDEDIRDFASGAQIPKHHVLAAGFPCQPFSIAGVSKKKSLGRDHGFKDKAQGTLFFQLATIIEMKRPEILLLENVKNLRSHNKGDTWQTICNRLDQLGYRVFDETIDAASYVPQHRERIFIVGFRKDIYGEDPPFEFPDPPDIPRPRFGDILEPSTKVPDKYTLSDQLWNYLQEYKKRHAARGNGFGFGLADRNGISRTLSARYYKDGAEILIPQKRKNPRRLMPVESARLMGFPPQYADNQVVSDTRAYKQYGNAVVPPVAEAVARQIVKVMLWQRLTLPAQG
ncbi:MAG: DNA (cytosine-5-)-methyltransferase [Fuerstiella sp.]|nr:DNA (cytosine-5-)-methyltransferase [Fuerstiella sp.]